VPGHGRECKRVQESRNLSSEARRCRGASLVRLCNTFIVEPYIHKRGLCRPIYGYDPVSLRARDTRYREPITVQ